ncbi:MAG: hemolysin III family protein [Bacteroidetes bacterium]|nr:hemolysin III family protein [Bacteroidota bacterium]
MDKKPYSLGEEIANSVTHGIGVALAIAGLVILIVVAAVNGTTIHVVSFTIFGVSLIALYLASTLYHAITNPRAKAFLKVVDHSAIFILIAGTYTPFMLAFVGGAWGWSIFGVIWGLAITGIILKLFLIHQMKWVSPVIYLGMGWLCVIAFPQIMNSIPNHSLILLFSGGLTYSLGVIFYVIKRIPYFHSVWHLFVLGGSIQHYLAIVLAV